MSSNFEPNHVWNAPRCRRSSPTRGPILGQRQSIGALMSTAKLFDFIHSLFTCCSRFEGQKSAPCRVSDALRRVGPISLNHLSSPLFAAAFVLCSRRRILSRACRPRPQSGYTAARAIPGSDPPVSQRHVAVPTRSNPPPGAQPRPWDKPPSRRVDRRCSGRVLARNGVLGRLKARLQQLQRFGHPCFIGTFSTQIRTCWK